MKLIFLDESGFAKNWKESINDQPFHVLGGVLVDSQAYFSASKSLRDAVMGLGLEKIDHPLGHGFEIKAKERGIAEEDFAQTLNYLKCSGCKIGLVLNFAKMKLEIKRVIF